MINEIFFPKTSCGLSNVFTFLEQSGQALVQDLESRNDGTLTAEKVKNYMTAYLDVGAAAQVSVSIVFGIGLITTMRVRTFVIKTAIVGFFTNEIYQFRSHLKQLLNKVEVQCPNPSDSFVMNPQFYQDWCEFKEGVLSDTYLFSNMAKEELDKMTSSLKQLSELEGTYLMRGVRAVSGFLDTGVGKIFRGLFGK